MAMCHFAVGQQCEVTPCGALLKMKLNKKPLIEMVPKRCICLGPPYALNSSHFFRHL